MNKKKLTENLRIKISDHLTNVLLLIGKLDSVYNALNLPDSLRQLLPYISRLEMLERTHDDFPKEFRENITVRENHSKVFMIPASFLDDPTVNGLRSVISGLADRQVKTYCREIKKNLIEKLNSNLPVRSKYLLLVKTIEDCVFLSALCTKQNVVLTDDLNKFCQRELAQLE